ncbi:MAG: ABC transporter permease, partial [Ktedonobacteraceae bacterium]|nr:ABC transporter permease [Ktedonobacteraceae bacterium]
MSWRAILTIARKDLLDLAANKACLLMLPLPIVMALLYAVILGLFGSQTTRMLIYNPSNSKVEQAVTAYFDHASVTHVSSEQDVKHAFANPNEAAYTLGMIIPANFDEGVHRGEQMHVDIYLGGTEAEKTTHMAVQSLVKSYAADLRDPQSVAVNVVLDAHTADTFSAITSMSTLFTQVALECSFLFALSCISTLLVEEREKKTLRMLIVAPVTMADVVMAKLLFGLAYQFVMTVIVLAIMGGVTGNLPLLLLFLLLNTCFMLVMGIWAGITFQTTAALGGCNGILGLFFIFPGMFVSAP